MAKKKSNLPLPSFEKIVALVKEEFCFYSSPRDWQNGFNACARVMYKKIKEILDNRKLEGTPRNFKKIFEEELKKYAENYDYPDIAMAVLGNTDVRALCYEVCKKIKLENNNG
jgi:hypothetical protein